MDIGSYSLKIAECQRSRTRVSLQNYEIRRLPLPGGGLETLSPMELAAFLKETLRETGIRTQDTITQVGGPQTAVRHLLLPDMPDEEMREGIRWGAKQDFPFALEEAYIDFLKIGLRDKGEEGQEAELMAVAAMKESVEGHTELLREAGLKPLVIGAQAFSLMQAYRLFEPPPWQETVGLVDIGHRGTHIVVLKDGILKFSRETAVAGEAFTQALTNPFEFGDQSLTLDERRAEKIKFQVGLRKREGDGTTEEGIPLTEVNTRLESIANRLVLELERSLNFYKNQFKDFNINRLFLVGGGSLLPGLQTFIQANLEIPVLTFSSLGPLTLKRKLNENHLLRVLSFMTPILGLVSQPESLINLIPIAVPQVREFSLKPLLKPALAGLLPLGVIFFFASQYWTFQNQSLQLQKDFKAKNDQIARVGKASQELAQLEQEEQKLNAELSVYPPLEIKKLPMAAIIAELGRIVPPNMTLTRLQFARLEAAQATPGAEPETMPKKTVPQAETKAPLTGQPVYNLLIQGIIFGPDPEMMATLTGFAKKLNTSAFFKRARIQMTHKMTEYAKTASEFEVQAELRDDPGASHRVSS
jgi:type IV pilus assembly protein PilM